MMKRVKVAMAATALSIGAAALAPTASAAGGVQCGEARLTGSFPNIDGDIIHSCTVTGDGALVTYTVDCLVGSRAVQANWTKSQSRQISFDCPPGGALSSTSVTWKANPN